MRDIKFRGKRIDNGEWVYGAYMEQYHSYKHGGRIDAIFESDAFHTKRYPVNPATVGQFTGLVDSNGVEIYEGDVIVYTYIYANGSTRVFPPRAIKWYRDSCNFNMSRAGNETTIEVIGNTTDNLELIEREG